MNRYSILGASVLAAAIWSLASIASVQAACSPTGFYVDGTNLTAALINPGNVTGTVDASGCNIGVYYDDGTDGGPVGGTVSGATISGLYVAGSSGANYFGVVANGGGGTNPVVVNVTNSTIEDIGESPINGAQHGNAVFYINGSTDTSKDDSRTCSNVGSTTGTISGNTVDGYQKNGITAKCPGVSVIISNNTVTGADETDAIGQNGIELGQGAAGTISSNMVKNNEYTGGKNVNGGGDADSSGILVFGGGPFGALSIGVHVTGNTLTDNDVGIFALSCNADCSAPPSTPTVNIIQKNAITI
jgi:hypothetical protein